MNVDILFTPLEASADRLAGRAVIVIDVFRATSCICTAMENGAKELIPVTTIDQALALRHTLSGTAKVLLGGERKTKKIEGFDLDNSPISYSRQVVQGAMIVMSTTNGTRALQVAVAAGGARIFVASLLNARAVAQMVGALGLDISILCAGRHDRYTIEDSLCAAMIASIIQEHHTVDFSDSTWATVDFYERYRSDLRVPLRHCAHYNQIIQGGLADDVAYCLNENTMDIVPELDSVSGVIRGPR